MSEQFVFRYPLHISQFNASRNVLRSTGFVLIANLSWQCDYVLKVGLHFTGIFGEKKDGLIAAYMIETKLYTVTHSVYVLTCLVSYICPIVSVRTSILFLFAQG
jgi:hypothetical protein